MSSNAVAGNTNRSTPFAATADRWLAFVASQWAAIVICLVLALVFGYVYWANARKMYRATMTVMIVPPPGGDPKGADFSPARYSFIFGSNAVRKAGTVAAGFKNTDDFIGPLTALPVPNSPTIALSIVCTQAEPCAKALDAMWKQAREINLRFLGDADSAARTLVKEELDTARTQFAASESALRKFQASSRLERQKDAIDRLRAEAGQLNGIRTGTSAQLVQLNAALPVLGDELSRQSKLISMKRTPAEEARSGVYQVEDVNPVFDKLEPSYIQMKADLAGAKSSNQAASTQLKAHESALDGAVNRYQADSLEQTRLADAYAQSRERVKVLSERLDALRMTQSANHADLSVLDDVYASPDPISPRAQSIAVFSVLLGLAAAAMWLAVVGLRRGLFEI